jgi:hypothetical protein
MAANYLEKFTEYPQIVELLNQNIGKKTRQELWKMAAQILKIEDYHRSWRRYDFYELCDKIERHKVREGMEESPPTAEETEKNIEIARATAIALFAKELKELELNPKKWTGQTIDKLTRLYKVIREETEAAERTKIAKGKLKLEAVRTLLPYQRMPLAELLKLQAEVNAAIEQIKQLKNGESGEVVIGNRGT